MDYDVAVLGLASPPPQAVVTPYRPAVSVRNHGIHNAIASGYLRIYSAGLRIFETEVYSGTLAPGATGTADAVDYWTPPAEGPYIVNGYVSTPLDQVEPNNNLAPVTIIVTGGPVPPTPTVPLHASQHEEGGTDPVNVDGLPGVLADRQPAQPHAAQHQAGGDDAVNVSGLAGVLGDPQTPIVHGNAHHNPVMSTAAELTAHSGSTSVHTAAANLANRNLSGEDAGLVDILQLGKGSEPGGTPASRYLAQDRIWRTAQGGSGAQSLGANADMVQLLPTMAANLITLTAPSAWMPDDMQFVLKLCGFIHSLVSSGGTLNLTLLLGQDNLGYLSIPADAISDRDFTLEADILGRPNGIATGSLRWLTSGPLPTDFELFQSNENTITERPNGADITVLAEFINAHQDTFLQQMSGYIRALHQPA